jgi:hypothetical protein
MLIVYWFFKVLILFEKFTILNIANMATMHSKITNKKLSAKMFSVEVANMFWRDTCRGIVYRFIVKFYEDI